jgi:hypothetical protein
MFNSFNAENASDIFDCGIIASILFIVTSVFYYFY